MLGTVKWFDVNKGYGFIKPDGGGPDCFVHVRDVQRAGLQSLTENQRVKFDLLGSKNGKESAQNIALI
jgi:CspA family cold shock protein